MNQSIHSFTGVLVAALLMSTTFTAARADDGGARLELPVPAKEMSAAQWDAFSQSLRTALASRHEGLQDAAMRLTIEYADFVHVGDAVIELMRIYRDHPDVNVRRMAVVALASTRTDRALSYLRLHEPFEVSSIVQQTMRAILTSG